MNRGYTFLWRKTWANPLLIETGKKFSRLEAWLYLTNVLAAGIEDPDTGLKRGEFSVSVRHLAKLRNWDPAAAFRFLRLLEENCMISRVKQQAEHLAEQEAEQFAICNYGTYNPERNTKRNTIKEGINEKTQSYPATRDARVSPKNLPATQPGAAQGEDTYFRKAEESPVKD